MAVNAVIELHYCAQALSHSRAGTDKTGEMVKRAGFLRSRQHNYGGGQINASQDLGQLFAIGDFYFQSEIFPNRAHDAVRAENNNNRIDLQLLKAFSANPAALAPIVAEIAKLTDPTALPTPERAAIIQILRDVLDVKRMAEVSVGVTKVTQPVAALIERMSQALVKHTNVLKSLPAITQFAAAIVTASAKTIAVPAVMTSARVFTQISEGVRVGLPAPALRAILQPVAPILSPKIQGTPKGSDIKPQQAGKIEAVKSEAKPEILKSTAPRVTRKPAPVVQNAVKAGPTLKPAPKIVTPGAVQTTTKHVPIKSASAPRSVPLSAPVPLPVSRIMPVANARQPLPNIVKTINKPAAITPTVPAPVPAASAPKVFIPAAPASPTHVPTVTPVAVAVAVHAAPVAAIIAKAVPIAASPVPDLKIAVVAQKDMPVMALKQDAPKVEATKIDPPKNDQPKAEPQTGLCSNFCACAQHGASAPVIQTQADVVKVLGAEVSRRVSVDDAKAFIHSDVQAAQIIQTQKIETFSTAGEHMKADLLKTMAKMEAAQKDGKPFQHIHGRFCGCAAHAMPVTPVAESVAKTKAVASAPKADTKTIKTMTFEP